MQRTALWIMLPATMMAVSPANAHWQYTKWGMSPAEVATAASGKAPISTDEVKKRFVGNRGPFDGGKYAFSAEYVYTDGKLDTVSLRLNAPATCAVLASDLRVKYGAPSSMQRPIPSIQKTVWSDQEGGNRIELSDVGDTCYVNYSPLNDASLNAL